jgi:hypothetical protein
MKILELADLHLDPKWIEQQKPCLDKIKYVVENERVHFVCIAGDIFNRPLYNSDNDYISYIQNYFKELAFITNVIIIYGTPAHDTAGSLSILKNVGCYIIKPEKPQIIFNYLFIGLPEIDKSHFIAKNKCSMKDANLKIQENINKFITEFWVPCREANKNIPCIFLGHGVFVDNIHHNNPIIRNTDFIIDNKILTEINADRYIFGHIHTPSESKILNGGYVGFTGFDDHPWNSTGFQPGFNLTEIKKSDMFINYRSEIVPRFLTETVRIDYPVVRKNKFKIDYNNFKIKEYSKNLLNSNSFDVRINLKIKKADLLKVNIHDYENKIKNNYSLNSCKIIPEIIKEESQRITYEQAEKLNTLWEKYCFFKGWENTHDYEVSQDKINEIEKNVSFQSKHREKIIVDLLYLEIKNSIFSIDGQGKNTFVYDFSKDTTGLILIEGDNGQGKSSFFGFASPYPVFIGFDYRSLKELFLGDGHIKKEFNVNGIIHRHIISIRENKIECFWFYREEGKMLFRNLHNALSLKNFMIECEKFFGPLSSFISTSFFSQEPWRMKNFTSSITSSNSTDMRNAYHEIIGISREKEKLYAREKKVILNLECSGLNMKKNTMLELIKDKYMIWNKIVELKRNLNILDNKANEFVYEENEKRKEFDNLKVENENQILINMKIKNIENEIHSKQVQKNIIQEKIRRLKKNDIKKLKENLAENKKFKIAIENQYKKIQQLTKQKEEIKQDRDYHQSCIIDCNIKIKELKNNIIILFNENENLRNQNSFLSVPCENCNHINKKNKDTIKENEIIIKENEKKAKGYNIQINQYIELKKEHVKDINKLDIQNIIDEMKEGENTIKNLKKLLLTELDISAINNSINQYSKIEVYEENLKNLNDELDILIKNKNDFVDKINPHIEKNYNELGNELYLIHNNIIEIDKNISSNQVLLKEKKNQYSNIQQYEKNIKDLKKRIDFLDFEIHEWEIIERDMASNKFPAFELDIILRDIDFSINQKLKGKYIIKTITQDINKNGEIIDRFDILVYNPISGIEKSLLKHSPGQRALYFHEPISQALREKRQENENIIFQWSIYDEQDNFIKYKHIQKYFDAMQDSLPEGHTRFIMSQKSEIYNFIKNTINIEEIGKNT